MRDWLKERIFLEVECIGVNVKPWRAIAADSRMGEVWQLLATWPERDARTLIEIAASRANPQMRAAMDAMAEEQSEQRIEAAAAALRSELQSHSSTASHLLGNELRPFLNQLDALVESAARHAAIGRQLFPRISPKVRDDPNQLILREVLANQIARSRAAGAKVTLSEQHRLVAILTNVVFELTGNAVVKPSSEKQRWKRHRQAA